MQKNKKPEKSNLRLWWEYSLIKGGCKVIGIMPEFLAVWFGKFIGLYSYVTRGRARRCARKNITIAIPELTEKEIERIVWQTFQNLGLTMVEVLWNIKNVNKSDVDKRFPITVDGAVQSALDSGKAVILCTLHLGNWEFFGARGAALFKGLHAVGKPASNPLIDKFLASLRSQMGITVCNTTDGVRPMLAALKNNKPLAILIDQHVRTAFVETKFFEHTVNTTSVPAALAMKLNVPMFVAYSIREGNSFRHKGFFEKIDMVNTGDREADIAKNMQLVNDRFEEIIRQNPGLWLWTYKRWRFNNIDMDKEFASAD